MWLQRNRRRECQLDWCEVCHVSYHAYLAPSRASFPFLSLIAFHVTKASVMWERSLPLVEWLLIIGNYIMVSQPRLSLGPLEVPLICFWTPLNGSRTRMAQRVMIILLQCFLVLELRQQRTRLNWNSLDLHHVYKHMCEGNSLVLTSTPSQHLILTILGVVVHILVLTISDISSLWIEGKTSSWNERPEFKLESNAKLKFIFWV